jgi:hypothetical protein
MNMMDNGLERITGNNLGDVLSDEVGANNATPKKQCESAVENWLSKGGTSQS